MQPLPDQPKSQPQSPGFKSPGDLLKDDQLNRDILLLLEMDPWDPDEVENDVDERKLSNIRKEECVARLKEINLIEDSTAFHINLHTYEN